MARGPAARDTDPSFVAVYGPVFRLKEHRKLRAVMREFLVKVPEHLITPGEVLEEIPSGIIGEHGQKPCGGALRFATRDRRQSRAAGKDIVDAFCVEAIKAEIEKELLRCGMYGRMRRKRITYGISYLSD